MLVELATARYSGGTHPFLLQSQAHDDIGIAKCDVELVVAFDPQGFNIGGDQSIWPDDTEFANTQRNQRRDVGSSNA